MKSSYPIDFRRPENARDLSSYIGVQSEFFLAAIDPKFKKEFYSAHLIPKRSPHRAEKYRIVWETLMPPVKEAHKAIARRFDLFARSADPRFPHHASYGYIRRRGTRENAQVHCGAPLLLRADIRNFFPTITINRLISRFLQLGMKPAAASALGNFVTIDDHLPLGLNASPMLANLICVDLDLEIEKLAMNYGCRYSRYADDIAISGRRKLPSKEELQEVIEKQGFKISNEKFRITKLGQAHYVTGLSVSDPKGPHVPRMMKRRLRQELYYCGKFGVGRHLLRIGEPTIQSGINRLDGTVHYVAHIETAKSQTIRSEWEACLRKDLLGPSYEPLEVETARNVTCYVDESEFYVGNRSYLALCLIFTEDEVALQAATVATLRDHVIGDPFYAGDREPLARRGLHFVDSHPDLRTAYIKQLSTLPYQAFVLFGELGDHSKYSDTYELLLGKMLARRLIWLDGTNLRFVFEENSKIKIESLKKVVGSVYESLEISNNRRPLRCPSVQFANKLQEACFSVPDYLLAVFCRFAQLNEKQEEVRRHQFERLRDKYRLIVDIDSGQEFSRKQPFKPLHPIDESGA